MFWFGDYPLVNIQKAIENFPVEIVDLPMNIMVIFQFAMLVFTRGYTQNIPKFIGDGDLMGESQGPGHEMPNLWLPGTWISTCAGISPHDLKYTDVSAGKHTKSYWKWPFIVDFPIKNGDFP